MSSIHEHVKVGSDKMTSFLFSSIAVQRYSLIHSIYAFHILYIENTRLPEFLQGHGRIPTRTSSELLEHCSRDHCRRRCIITLGGTFKKQSIFCYRRLLDISQSRSVLWHDYQQYIMSVSLYPDFFDP